MDSATEVRNRWLMMSALMCATLMTTLDSTIANVALPHMMGSLSASQDQITWVLTSYILATAVATPFTGWLALKIGRKTVFLISIAAFTITSMACGVAQNLPEMVLFRTVQGLVGASLMPLSQNAMLDTFPPRQIPHVMSMWSAVVIMGPIIGPGIGGWLTENFSWRWVFYVNLPFGLISFLGVYLLMARDEGGRQRPFDFLGFGALAAFVCGFQLMLDRGPDNDWFGSAETWVEAIIAAIGLYVFVLQTMTARNPFFHRDLAKDSNFVTCTTFGLLIGAVITSTTALLPTFMQNLLGYSALQSGYATMPRGAGSLIAFLSVPYLVMRFGPRPVLFAGLAIGSAALWQMSHFDLDMTAGPIMLTGLIQGLGVGLLFAPLNTLAFANLDPVHRTEATVVFTMSRNLGSSLGISIVEALLTHGASVAHARLTDKIIGGDPMVNAQLPSMMKPATDSGLTALNGEITRQATMVSYDVIFAWMALGTLGMVPLVMLMRRPRAQPSRGLAMEAHAD